jgi:predicted ester cyclase
MSLEENKALVRWYLEELYRDNLGVLDEVLGPEYFTPEAGSSTTMGARYKTNFSAFRRAFPDAQLRIEAIIAEGDLVALHCTIRGTHLGEYRGLAPTGKQAEWEATVFRRVRDGKIVDDFGTWDILSLLEQLGATVTPPDAPTMGTTD